MRNLLILILCSCFFLVAEVNAQDQPSDSTAETIIIESDGGGGEATGVEKFKNWTPEQSRSRRGLRRRLGITRGNIARIATMLAEQDKLSDDSSEAADQVMEIIKQENSKAWNELAPQIDWTGFFAFLERFLELFMKFLPIITS